MKLILAFKSASCSLFCSGSLGTPVFSTCYEQLGKLLRLFELLGALLSDFGLTEALVLSCEDGRKHPAQIVI